MVGGVDKGEVKAVGVSENLGERRTTGLVFLTRYVSVSGCGWVSK